MFWLAHLPAIYIWSWQQKIKLENNRTLSYSKRAKEIFQLVLWRFHTTKYQEFKIFLIPTIMLLLLMTTNSRWSTAFFWPWDEIINNITYSQVQLHQFPTRSQPVLLYHNHQHHMTRHPPPECCLWHHEVSPCSTDRHNVFCTVVGRACPALPRTYHSQPGTFCVYKHVREVYHHFKRVQISGQAHQYWIRLTTKAFTKIDNP